MHRKFTIFFFLLCIPIINSQTLKAELLNFNEQPIQGVKVFYNQSTIATYTNKDGIFEIPLSQSLPDPTLVFYHPKYEIYAITNIPKLRAKYYLKPKKEQKKLSGIPSGVLNSPETYEIFRDNFLGNSKNARDTSISNKEAILMRFDTVNYKLYAEASEPLRIKNDALGYAVEYYLDDFEVEFSANTLQQNFIDYSFFHGYSFFKEIDSTKSKQRQIANSGTLNHFFKQLITGNHNKIKSKVFKGNKRLRTKKLFNVEEINPNLYKLKLNTDYVDYDGGDFTFYIQPHYRKQRSRTYYLNMNNMPYFENKSISISLYRPYILVDNNGNPLRKNTYDVSGEIFEIYLADLLPLDYNLKEQ